MEENTEKLRKQIKAVGNNLGLGLERERERG
jgi:hypothetical protein